ncbi:MAG: bifunctional 3,4-dihydroxy-2-butanone-4-phosphate synthase/GTP cyclohydrolase II [Ignavibacteria bacterium]|nr:bifunctional 3,4-dihydroxy-2-butanone-4-phosphate synthase/GTP cyclohydrolase II [Ignavibacteria bacterium]
MEKVFCSVEEAIEEIRAGKVIIVVDDEERENEGDFVCAAEFVTPDIVNFMITHGRGLVCVPLTEERVQELELPLMANNNNALHGTQFTVSVDSVTGNTTGISAIDRAVTIKKLIDERNTKSDFAIPGHVFPLKAASEGVLRRAGHTEAVVDLCKLAGLKPAGVLCEILKDNGEMARLPELTKIAEEFSMKILTVKDVIEYRIQRETVIENLVDVKLPTHLGEFQLYMFKSKIDQKEHLALVKGTIDPEQPVLVRMHSECFTGDVFHSLRCDCHDQLNNSLERISQEESGVLVYMRQEGRGIGLHNKLLAYKLQDNGKDTVEANEALGFPADLRDYGLGAQILRQLGIRKIRLLTNNPRKVIGLKGYGLEIVERLPIEIAPNENNLRYLQTKRDKLGHLILDK